MYKSIVLALLLAAGSANAAVPASNAQTDTLGQKIQGRDVYTLPANKLIYHGTVAIFSEFKPMKVSTWFGADIETSAAMGYWRWCAEKTKSGSYPANPPQLLTVKTKKELNLLLVPVGWDGHSVAAAAIGMPWTNKSKSLYGSGSTGQGVQTMLDTICKTEVWKDSNGHITYYRRDKKVCARGTLESGCSGAKAPSGTPVKLNGWRAPWDQNEIAICSADTTSNTFEIQTDHTIKLPMIMKTSGSTIDGSATCAKGSNYKTKAKFKIDKATGYYDVIFTDPTEIRRFLNK